jgi:Flp pilus assembly protein TadD
MRRAVGLLLLLPLAFWLAACAHKEQPKPRSPLAISPSFPRTVIEANQQGTVQYQSGDFEGAKSLFTQVVTGAPQSAEAHYNLGLALYALGEADEARDHFIEAANLAPGNKVIWDSPALRPYGSPDPNIPPKKAKEYQGRAGGRIGQR